MLRVCIAMIVLSLGVRAEARPGKVVRVERRSTASIGNPRLCTMQPPEMRTAYCWGPRVEAGEIITILGPKQAAQLKIKSATAYPGCNFQGQPQIWQVEGDPEGDVHGVATNPSGQYYGIVDGNLDWHRSRLVQIDASVSGRQTDMEPFGIDREGDGRPDLSWDHFVCDDQGNPSQTATANCWEVWADSGHGWKRVRVDVIKGC